MASQAGMAMAAELKFLWWAEFRPVIMRYDGGHMP